MSLFSLEEICEGCIKAVFHKCCNGFCHCKDGHEDDTNDRHGTCPHKVEDSPTDTTLKGD